MNEIIFYYIPPLSLILYFLGHFITLLVQSLSINGQQLMFILQNHWVLPKSVWLIDWLKMWLYRPVISRQLVHLQLTNETALRSVCL